MHCRLTTWHMAKAITPLTAKKRSGTPPWAFLASSQIITWYVLGLYRVRTHVHGKWWSNDESRVFRFPIILFISKPGINSTCSDERRVIMRGPRRVHVRWGVAGTSATYDHLSFRNPSLYYFFPIAFLILRTPISNIIRVAIGAARGLKGSSRLSRRYSVGFLCFLVEFSSISGAARRLWSEFLYWCSRAVHDVTSQRKYIHTRYMFTCISGIGNCQRRVYLIYWFPAKKRFIVKQKSK